jgi:hypothetical protein
MAAGAQGLKRIKGGLPMYRKSSRVGSAASTVVTIIAILALAGGAVWYFMLRSTPEKAVATMLQAQIDGDTEALKSVLTEDSQQWASMSGAAMGAANQDAPEYEIGEAEIDGDDATVPVSYAIPEDMQQFTNTTEFEIDYVCQREDGAWKIDLADTMRSMMGGGMGGCGMAPRGGMQR